MSNPGRAPRPALALILVLAAQGVCMPVWALDLAWPMGAERVTAQDGATAGFRIATGPHDGSALSVMDVDGDLFEEVWRIPGDMGDPALLLGLIRDQLTVQGYAIGFTCSDRDCGGFDFRYALPIPAEPDMHVDLGQFHYLTATRPGATEPTHVAFTISHGGQHGYVHLARIAPPGALPAPVTSSTRQVGVSGDADPDDGLIASLAATGYAVLSDVEFDTGASSLSGTEFESLITLAAYLAEDPARRVVLVGHTDTEGSLDANTGLSRARAAAVRAHLLDILGVDPRQVDAAGVGFLAPRASNETAAGREANRRVEVVLISR